MRQACVFILCVLFIFCIAAPPAPAAASNDSLGSLAGQNEPNGAGGPDEPEETEESVWEVTGIKKSLASDIFIVKRDSEPMLPDMLPFDIQDQFGDTFYYYLDIFWDEASLDTSVCGDFIVDITVVPGQWESMKFTQNEYTLPVTLRVVDAMPPDLLGGRVMIWPVGESQFFMNVYYAIPFPNDPSNEEYLDVYLEISLDEGESWQEYTNVSFYPSNFGTGLLDLGAVYFFRITANGDGLLQGVSKIFAIKADGRDSYEIWDGNGVRDGDNREEQPELPSAPPAETPKPTPVQPQETPGNAQGASGNTTEQGGGNSDETTAGSVGDEPLTTENKAAAQFAPASGSVPPALPAAAMPQRLAAAISPQSTAALSPRPSASASPRADATAPPTPVAEQDGADFVTLSGKRIEALTESGEAVAFVKNGVRLLMSAELFTELNLSENDLFTVVLQMPDRNTLHLAFSLNGAPLTDSFGVAFDILFPYTPGPDESAAGLVCADSLGDHVPTLYNEQDKLLSFSLNAGGEYTILPVATTEITLPQSPASEWVAPEASQAAAKPALPPFAILAIAAVIIVPAAGGIIWIRHFRHNIKKR